jgi:hypothetical protein
VIRNKSRFAVLLPVSAVLIALAAHAYSQQTVTVKASAVIEPQATDTTTTITAKGEVDLADDYVLKVTLTFRGVALADASVPVAQHSYAAHFGPWKKILLPGHYEVVLEVPPALQKAQFKGPSGQLKLSPDRFAFDVGTPAEQAARADSVKKKMVDVLEGIRLAYTELNQSGTYYRAELQMLKLSSRIANIPADKQEANKKKYLQRQHEILPIWQGTTRSEWDERFKTARYDWKTFRGQIVGSPFPEVEVKVDGVFKLVETWYKGMNAAICELCGEALPKEETEGAADPLKLDPEIFSAAKTCYEGLGYPQMPQWKNSDLSQGETGEIKAGWYKSYVSKFMIKQPEGWGFYPGGVLPSDRIRFTPPDIADPKKRSPVMIVVEILDFASATDVKNLAALAREANHTRWRNAKELKSENLEAPDATMPRGTRPGIDTQLLIIEGSFRFRARYYQLFCRWHKRTYGVLCLAPEDKYSALEETFRRTCSSFRVLDAPEFADLAEAERQAEIKKEGRDPMDAYRKAEQFSHPDDKPGDAAKPDPNQKKKDDPPK